MFAPNDPRLSTMNRMPAWQSPGPLQPVQLTPGFRAPPGMGGLPGAPQTPQMGMPQMDPAMMAGLAGMMKKDPTNPGVPTPEGDPTGGAGPAFLGGNTSLGAEPSSGSFLSWLKGLF